VVAADGTPLSVRTWRGPPHKTPLVLCDGLACDGYVWPYLLKRFVGERSIVHMHWRGHGKSGVPDDLRSVRVPVLVDDLARALDETGIASGVWVGHSMGVQICLEGFRRARARVQALALWCGSFERPIDTWHHAFFFGEPPPLGNVVMRRVFGRVTSTIIERWSTLEPLWQRFIASGFALDATVRGELNPALLRPDDFRPYMQHLAQMDMRVSAHLAKDLAEHSARDVLPRIDVPTLIVGGGRDRFCPLWLAEEMHRLIPRSELLRLVQGSHCAPLEEPRIVERHMVKLLERVDAAR
jgi:pimeloyl-ACP methyl ester carboxylesterase